MPTEIERKFLVHPAKWQALIKPAGKSYRQGYLTLGEDPSVRIRISGNEAYMTIKGKSVGASRLEFEYPIPAGEAAQMLDNFSRGELSKTRYEIECAGKCWEVDVFHGENEGLVLAELELESEDEPVELPDWVAEEVTYDPRYYNANLVVEPFGRWA